MGELRITGLSEDMVTLSNLSWRKPVEEWPEEDGLASMRGISRHIVRLVRTGPGDREVFAVKETVPEFAQKEYALLRELNNRNAPCELTRGQATDIINPQENRYTCILDGDGQRNKTPVRNTDEPPTRAPRNRT